MKPTGIVFFPAFDWAISPTHPEREERLLYTRDQLFEEGIMDLPQIREYQPRLALPKDIARVHFCVPTIEAQITEAHRISCGGALVMADAFMSGEVRNAFALVRPPGHHSMRVTHGNRGFCNINNEPIMIEYLRRKYGVKRVAIVDTDVHHGDGTQDIYWHDPDVLFISFHQDGRTLYPGSGFTDEIGGPLALGTTLNVPLPPGTTDEGIHYVLDHLVLPVLKEFAPEVVVNSAGQDNHYSDPLANMRFSARGYAVLNEKLAPDIAVLEGGYSVETALPYVNMGIIMAMAGIDYSNLYEPDYREGQFVERPERLRQLQQMVDELTGV
ncbi:MAG: histone deacetylase, partial [Syntrophomonadaceae bacterium]|nr:histone deacetylase [Syntrophomonadaceae bacterium]